MRINEDDQRFEQAALKIRVDLGRIQAEHGLTNAEMSVVLATHLGHLAQDQVRAERGRA
jgi:hypothetical protein